MNKPTVVILEQHEIKPYPNNPRKNEEAVESVMTSIKRNGYNTPIEVDENFVILSGHTRYKALIRLGWKKIPVLVISHLNEDQKIEYRVTANKTGEVAQWDDEKVIAEFRKLSDLQSTIDAFPDLSLERWATKIEQDEQNYERTREQLDQQFSDGQQHFSQACCPKCGHEFQIIEK